MRLAHNNKAFALVWFIILIVLATILGSALFTGSFINNQLASNYYNIRNAYYTAQAGVEYARIIISNPTIYNILDSTDGGGGVNRWR